MYVAMLHVSHKNGHKYFIVFKEKLRKSIIAQWPKPGYETPKARGSAALLFNPFITQGLEMEEGTSLCEAAEGPNLGH